MAIKNLGKVVGEDGRGIKKIEKTSTNGLVDTYTITYTDDTTSTFTVTNGKDGENSSGGGTGGSCLLTEQTITIGETGDVPVTGIELDYSTMNINVGESFQLAATVLPENASNNVVTWKSSDSSIATVSEGYVTGVKGGKANIIAISVENSSISASCSVSVLETVEPGGKIYFENLTPVNTGVILKKDGTSEFTHTSCYGYFELPYTEGMTVSTIENGSYITNYPGIFVIDQDGKVTVPQMEEIVMAGQIKNYVANLTGFSENVRVIANVSNVTGYMDKCYYIEGGN